MNTNPKVEQYLKELDNPLKDLWLEVRKIILGVDPRLEEDIKWGAPTFIYQGNLATFNPRAKKFVNLTFHTGAAIADPKGVLDGDAKEARVFRVENSGWKKWSRIGSNSKINRETPKKSPHSPRQIMFTGPDRTGIILFQEGY